jgi:hypothetical protein
MRVKAPVLALTTTMRQMVRMHAAAHWEPIRSLSDHKYVVTLEVKNKVGYFTQLITQDPGSTQVQARRHEGAKRERERERETIAPAAFR